MKKQLLLVTSNLVGDTGRVSFSYLFQDESIKICDLHPKQAFGPFGVVKLADEQNLYMNVFEGGKGLVFAAPIVIGDPERNKKVVEECFPDAFSLLCTKADAELLQKEISELVDIDVVFSNETLLTAK